MPSSYDINMPSEPVRILRSALPYLGNTVQHQVSLALKCMELQDILQSSIPSSEDSSLMRGGEENGEPTQNISDRRLQMLQSIRGACNPEHVGYVDTVIQTFHMQSMIQQIFLRTFCGYSRDSLFTKCENAFPFFRFET